MKVAKQFDFSYGQHTVLGLDQRFSVVAENLEQALRAYRQHTTEEPKEIKVWSFPVHLAPELFIPQCQRCEGTGTLLDADGTTPESCNVCGGSGIA